LGSEVAPKSAATEFFAAMQETMKITFRNRFRIPKLGGRGTKRERGSAVVEFSLVTVLVLFPLIFGIMDFARAAYAYHYVSFSAREAARWASVRGAQCANALPAPCEATSGAGGTVDSHVRSISPAGFYVNGNACAATAGCLLVTASWPGAPAGSNAPSSCSGGGGSNAPGCAVNVEVQYTFGFDLPFLPAATINMSSSSEVVISQ
jgi:Flp pilus assembly protein TadG